jgi:hypothetical protein
LQISFRNGAEDFIRTLAFKAKQAPAVPTEIEVNACLQVTPYLSTGKKSPRLDGESLT